MVAYYFIYWDVSLTVLVVTTCKLTLEKSVEYDKNSSHCSVL